MTRWRQSLLVGCVVALALGAGGCGSDDGSSQGDNNWDFREDGGGEDGSSDAGRQDIGSLDAGGEDTGGQDAGGQDVGGEDARDEDASGDRTTLTAEGLSSKPWYGISLLSAEPATTGSTLQIEFRQDMTVTVGFNEEVTGEWALFGEGRVRLFNLMRGSEPNQPQQLVLDADLEGDHLEGLELVIPDGSSGLPYVLRFEQLAAPDIVVEDIAGNWQTEETYTAENGGAYRLAIRILAGTFGYGAYNRTYIEFISGQAQVITYDTGETFWFSVPPDSTPPTPSLAGEVRSDGEGGYTIWAPREVTPDSGEFESVEMNRVDAFTNP